MASFNWNSGIAFDTNVARFFDGFGENSEFSALGCGGAPPPCLSSSSLVLDSEKGELVRAPAKLGHKVKSEAKALAALKNHSDAERRRRERINSHLNTLRSMVPCTEKMDKASLLAEVIDHVKKLKRTTTEACEGLLIPMDVDKVIVEPHEDASEGLFCIKASLFCEDRPEIFSDLKQAIVSFNLKTIKAEISTLEGRMKNVFVLQGFTAGNIGEAEVRQLVANSVRQSFISILDKYSCSTELSPRISYPNKRRKFSLFDSSSSSS